MKRLLLLSLIMGAVLLGCRPSITSGLIVDRQFRPSHVEQYSTTEYTYTYGCGGITFGGSGCGFGYHPTTVRKERTAPDSWWLQLQDGDRTGWVEVDKTTYDLYNVGSTFTKE